MCSDLRCCDVFDDTHDFDKLNLYIPTSFLTYDSAAASATFLYFFAIIWFFIIQQQYMLLWVFIYFPNFLF